MKTTETKDGFIWYILSEDEASEAFYGDTEAYLIFPDEIQLQRSDYPFGVLNALPVAIELGHAFELRADYDEACARNNETRSFEQWLIDKAENQIGG